MDTASFSKEFSNDYYPYQEMAQRP